MNRSPDYVLPSLVRYAVEFECCKQYGRPFFIPGRLHSIYSHLALHFLKLSAKLKYIDYTD